jgi:hypothetical protein
VAAAGVLAFVLSLGAASTAHAFSGGNHEEITRAALPWESKSLAAMADGDNGAVVANDHGAYFDDGTLHCDNADYLAPEYGPGYPRSRQQADAEIIACVRAALTRFEKAVAAADRLVDAGGKVKPAEVRLSPACQWNDKPGRAKCDVYENLGRSWHPIEDFYSHSNWTDWPSPYALGVHNPPGLKRDAVAEFFTLRRYSSLSEQQWVDDATRHIPRDLSTGCYPDADSTGHVSDCTGRTTHNGDLNKDTINSKRSMIRSNFDEAVSMATRDIARQWRDYQDELRARYGTRANTMICAVTHDDPVTACD